MYSTCLHCTKDLGANDVIETLPIGRRLAFDASKGRLWVVCRHCAKWNLVPFDTRLETIDACERIFADTRMQYSTDNIGIARVREGLELVRIGPALRPEYAAWRYGDSFGKRRRRNMLMAAGGIAAFGGLWFGAPALGVSMGGAFQLYHYGNLYYMYRHVAIRVPRPDRPPIELSPLLASKAMLVPWDDGGWAIGTKVLESGRLGKSASKQEQFISGPDAVPLLGRILGRVNHYGGSAKQVRSAVDVIEERNSLDVLLGGSDVLAGPGNKARPVRKLPNSIRLAAEMLVNEDTEREALSGELQYLEWQWKEAERLAKIGDDLELATHLLDDTDGRKDAS